jgi:hypothetical protein
MWKNLEELMKELLMLDNAITVPGSGNGKGEEDIIGLSTITQCKYSSKQNISVLYKDISRLLDAAKLQRKIPIFVNQNNGLILVSLPESEILKDVLHIIVGFSLCKFVKNNIINITTITKSEQIEYNNLLIRSEKIIDAVTHKYINSINNIKSDLTHKCNSEFEQATLFGDSNEK